MRGWLFKMCSARPSFRIFPVAATAQGGRCCEHAMAWLKDDFGHGLHGVKPAPVHADVDFAPFKPFNAKPVDIFGVNRANGAGQHGNPCTQCVNAPAKACRCPLNARAGAAIEPIGRIGCHALQSLPKHRQWPCQSLQRDGSICRRVDNASVGISKFRFQPIAAFGGVGFIAGKYHRADRGKQALHRARRCAFAQAGKPAFAGQGFGSDARHLNGKAAFFVIRCHIGQARRKPAPPSPRFAFGANDPAAQLNGLLPCQRGGEHGICGIKQMMAFIKDDAAWPVLFVTATRGVDHHQRVIGYHNLGLNRRTRCALNEAFFIMRASGINAFAAPVGQSGRTIAPE